MLPALCSWQRAGAAIEQAKTKGQTGRKRQKKEIHGFFYFQSLALGPVHTPAPRSGEGRRERIGAIASSIAIHPQHSGRWDPIMGAYGTHSSGRCRAPSPSGASG
jgi:hypothetical protein